MTRQEVEQAGFRHGDLTALLKRYDIARLRDGMNRLPDGETFYYISNPAVGLWAYRGRFA